jgi:hypothetical protein
MYPRILWELAEDLLESVEYTLGITASYIVPYDTSKFSRGNFRDICLVGCDAV